MRDFIHYMRFGNTLVIAGQNAQQNGDIAVLCWEAGSVPKGLMQLEALPGNSTNPKSYSFPVRFSRITGANMETVLYNPSAEILTRMINVSRDLIDDGVRAITTSCGFNAVFQRELAKALTVPVFSSSLLQIPMVSNMLGKDKSVIVITANKHALHRKHMSSVGISDDTSINIYGMESSEEWNKIFISPDMAVDLEQIEKDVLYISKQAVKEHPNAGAIVLECTDLPPFAPAIRKAIKLPVFDFITLMGYVAFSIGVVDSIPLH